MKLISYGLASAAATLLILSPVHAAFQPQVVSGDAQWVVYADFESLRDSAIGKELIDLAVKHQAKENNGVQIDFAKVLTAVGSMTAYGTSFSKEPEKMDGALIVQGTPDLRKIAEGFIAQQSVSSPEQCVEIKDLPFEAWSLQGQLVVAFPKEPIVLLSRSKDQLVKAHQVYRGEGPSLAKAKASAIAPLLKSPRKPFFQAASIVPSTEITSSAPQARILQMTKSAAVAIGEADSRAFAHVELVSTDDDMADKLLKIVQGVMAMASLAETNDKQLGEFLQSMKVERRDRAVTLDFAYASERVVQLVKNFQDTDSPRSHEENRPAKDDSATIAEWTADQELGHDSPNKLGLVDRTIENVALKQGTTITIRGQRNEGEHARIDVVELYPADGGKPLRFEAEQMVLQQYRIENFSGASGGKLVMANSNRASARFQFPAADGNYTMKVRYLDENDGKSTYRVSLKAPADASAPVEDNDD